MHSRTLLVILNAGAFILLLVLTMEAAVMRRSLRRIEHEERRFVTHCVAEGVVRAPERKSLSQAAG